MVKSNTRSESTNLDKFRGEEPKTGEEIERTTPPVDDDSGAAPRLDADDPPKPQDQRKDDQGDNDEPQASRMSPSDEARAKIAERFVAHRDDPPVPQDQDDPPDAGDDIEDPRKKAPETGPSALKGDDDKLTLTVFGKTVTKTVAEVASLSELSEEEVAENPARAIKYAQRELATTQRLSEARNSRSDKPAPAGDDRNERPDPNKDRKAQPGNEDDNDQPDPARKTTGTVDFKKLVEVIQIEDPEVAGEKLREAMNAVADERVGTVKKEISQGETDRLVKADRTQTSTATKEFLAAHEEVAGNDSVQSAMATALYKEYREDMAEVLVKSDGLEPDEAAEVVKAASNDQIARAHQHRRLIGDPHVRPISKAMLDSAYARVTKDLGVTAKPAAQQQQEFTDEREKRKAALPHQPRRASMPPATPPAPKQPLTRSSVVADMKKMRGQGGNATSR